MLFNLRSDLNETGAIEWEKIMASRFENVLGRFLFLEECQTVSEWSNKTSKKFISSCWCSITILLVLTCVFCYYKLLWLLLPACNWHHKYPDNVFTITYVLSLFITRAVYFCFVHVCYSLVVKLLPTIIRLITDNVSIDFTSGSNQLSNIDNER